MANLSHFQIFLSGGGANTDPLASIGGAMSTVSGGRVLSQAATNPNLTGVTVEDAMGNGIGAGTLTYTASGTLLRWQPAGGTAGATVNVGAAASGTYAIQGGNNGGVLLVSCTLASLPGADSSRSVTISNQTQQVFDDVTKTQSRDGKTSYRGIFFKNVDATDLMIDSRYWVEQNTPGADVIQVVNGVQAVTTALEVLADETTAPATVNFDTANPIDYATGLAIPQLDAAGAYYGIWMRRTVPPGTDVAQLSNTFRLGFRIYV